ncbi:MAG: hypothetical protein LBL24_09640, partial [Bacteroidales bacterium]|nr:hypothetical protein [Bacteroidales bacterium]
YCRKIFSSVGYSFKHTPSNDPTRPRLEKGAKKQIFYIPHIAMFRFFSGHGIFYSPPRRSKPCQACQGDSNSPAHTENKPMLWNCIRYF